MSTDLVRAIIEREIGRVDELARLPHGEESEAYSFRTGTSRYVIRLNGSRNGFDKDAFAHRRFARPVLPIPAVVSVSEADGWFYCISEHVAGVTLQDVPVEGLRPLLEPTARVMQAIAASGIEGITGFGPFNAQGEGRYGSWREFLTDVEDDGGREILVRLAARCPEERALVHGDFGSNNVVTDGAAITGVLDWSEAMIGDPLYDIANIFFWRTWLDCMEQQARWFERRLSADSDTAGRLLCYQLRIGLAEAQQSPWAAARCRELISRGVSRLP